ncbi:uncharacterized protein IWZ02DRAFT_435259 [Phyllosticta citriasiana]|uniref:uncharacterized protein n=1 Tax=Phyllosticta citriasiana TaxID=595635 RepID=UPI0030FD9231
MQFSTLIALIATTAAAAPFNSTIEARGLNETSALLPRGLNVTRIVEPRGLNDTSVLLPRGLNDTSILVGRSANVTVRSYNATKRGESATFPHVTIPKPVSGIFEGNKNIHALPNKTTNDVKRSYGSFGTGSGEDPKRQDHTRRANETSALVSPPQPAAPVTLEPPSNATTPSSWKSPLRRLQRHFRRQQLRFQAQAQDQPESRSNNASTATAANAQKRKADANAAPAAAACASSGMDFWALDHLKKSHRPDFPSSDTSREDFDVNGDGGGLCAVNTTTGSRAATAKRCCRCLLRSAVAAEATAALQMENCAPVARVATITASPAVSTATADDSPASSSPSSEPLEVSATAMTEHELPSLSGFGRGNTLISLWVATLFMTLFCDHV